MKINNKTWKGKGEVNWNPNRDPTTVKSLENCRLQGWPPTPLSFLSSGITGSLEFNVDLYSDRIGLATTMTTRRTKALVKSKTIGIRVVECVCV